MAVPFSGVCFHSDSTRKSKVSHAEPLYVDLVRDLGARKGEKEFNVGAGFTNFKGQSTHDWLIEYEFAPIHRLGLEAEIDFAHIRQEAQGKYKTEWRVEALRLSAQYSFFVSEKYKTTLALGYTQILAIESAKTLPVLFDNPFLVAARRWGKHLHSLVLINPQWEQGKDVLKNTRFQTHASVHYNLPGSKHFIGLELNHTDREGLVMRPQVKVKFNQSMSIGFVAGLPLDGERGGLSSFFRLILEP